jgi:5-methylcytosine-specific restriction endonuclease McrA
MGVSWEGSRRRETLPTDWAVIRPPILKRDSHCCQWRTAAGICGARANQVDHIDPNGGDDPSNLQSLCPPHHAIKSSREGGRAFGAIRKRMAAAKYRKPERHPGLKESA